MTDLDPEALEAAALALRNAVAADFGLSEIFGESVYRYDEYACVTILAYEEAKAKKAAPANNSWIPWTGGECPVDLNVEVITLHRAGNVHRATAKYIQWGTKAANPVRAYKIPYVQPLQGRQSNDGRARPRCTGE